VLREAKAALPRIAQTDESGAISYLESKNVWIRRAAASRLAALRAESDPVVAKGMTESEGTDEETTSDPPIATPTAAPPKPSPPSPAVDALIAALSDDDWRVRLKVCVALGAYADQRAIEPLIDTLVDPDRKVRLWAWKALRRLGEPAWMRMYERFAPDPQRKELSFIDESGIKRNLQEMMRGNLVVLGKQGVSVAGQMLASPSPEVRHTAAAILADLGAEAKDATLALIETTKHEDLETRLAAIRALGKIGQADPAVLPALEQLSKDENKRVLDEAKKALTEVKNASKKKADDKKKASPKKPAPKRK
ncbi:MAG: HEAT repeat domain-containing protein, partial [Myxococcota bacterium]|nr:HEAT repeat domain-containing protein [Myxococcota bacterium]